MQYLNAKSTYVLMNAIAIFLPIILLSSCSKYGINHSKIEKLETIQQVENLLHSIDSLSYPNIGEVDSTLISICNRETDSLGFKQRILKADVDQNGLLDAVVTGIFRSDLPSSIVILDKGEETYQVIDLAPRRYSYFGDLESGCLHPMVRYVGKQPIIELHYHKVDYKKIDLTNIEVGEVSTFTKTSLIYKFGGLIEYNPTPVNQKVESIEFNVYGGIRSPSFEGSINRNGTGKLIRHPIAIFYPQEIERKKFEGKIQDNLNKELFEVLSYIDLELLSVHYPTGLSPNYSNSTNGVLKISFNGKKKEISSFGLKGHFGLEKIYAILFRIKENLNWEVL